MSHLCFDQTLTTQFILVASGSSHRLTYSGTKDAACNNVTPLSISVITIIAVIPLVLPHFTQYSGFNITRARLELT